MAKYLLEVSYTLDGIKGLKSEGGSTRLAAATEAIEGLGGKIDAFYFAFGDRDVFVIADYPDNVSVAAAAIAVSAGGGARVRPPSFSLPQRLMRRPPRRRPIAHRAGSEQPHISRTHRRAPHVTDRGLRTPGTAPAPRIPALDGHRPDLAATNW